MKMLSGSKLVDAKQLSAAHGKRSCSQDVPYVAVVAFEGRSHAEMWCREGREVLESQYTVWWGHDRGTYDWLYLLEDASVIEQTDGIACDQAS